MAPRVLDPTALAVEFRQAIRAEIAALGASLTLVGLLAEGDVPSHTYAEYTKRGCDDVGMRFEVRAVRRDTIEQEARAASGDPRVDGILVYYPIGDRDSDGWVREIVDPRKDVEGLHSYWARSLYENRRFVDVAHTKRAILPCTPLAILKILDAAGTPSKEAPRPLSGRRVCVFNRSEVVGRPLAAMLANDGAEVVSFDVDGPLLFRPSGGPRGHDLESTSISRQEALARADVIVTGVPSRSFELVRAAEIKDGVVCINFSTLRNFADDAREKASVFVPRVGPMTVTMALRNTVRLHRNVHGR